MTGSGPEGTRIGGWLLVPALSLLAGLASQVYGLFIVSKTFLSVPFEVATAVPLATEATVCLVTFAMAAHVAWLFAHRRRALPTRFVQLCLLALVLNGLALGPNYLVGILPTNDDAKILTGLAHSTAFWMVFFAKSKRARTTFVR